MLHPKKFGTLPIEGSDEEKQTNEIKIVIHLLDCIDIQGKTITTDALLTQQAVAYYLVEKRKAHYHFTVKNNQKLLLKEIESFFENVHCEPDYTTQDKPAHGREQIRNIRVTSELNQYLNFPHVGQAFKVERITKNQKNGKKHLRNCIRNYE